MDSEKTALRKRFVAARGKFLAKVVAAESILAEADEHKALFRTIMGMR